MARRLRDDLLVRLVLPMATILLVSGVLSYHLAVRFANRSYDRSLLEDARSLSRVVKEEPGGRLILPAAALEMLGAPDEDPARFLIFTAEHVFMAGDKDLPPPEGDLSEPLLYDGQVRGQALRLAALTIHAWSGREAGVLVVAETRRRRESLASDIVAAVVAPQLALIFFAVVVIVGGVDSGLEPLKALAEAIMRRRRDDLAPLPGDAVPGEAAPLIEAFNNLLARVAEVMAVQQRFVADAAHQLRTPLAVLKIQVEHALQETDPARLRPLLQQLDSSVERMARLSSQLLLLARAEPGGGPQVSEPLDLRALALETGGFWARRALDAGRDLGFDSGEAPVRIKGDRTLLGEMMANLIDNALRYGGPNVTLRVTEGVGAAGPEVAVEDDGAGIPLTERSHVFERFHRVPGTAGDGSGLGLAIVREIAGRHGASVALESPETGGLRIRVRFPQVSPPNPHVIGESR